MTTPDETLGEFADDGPDELLVAYLDGQLDAAECERLESRLAEDEPTRERLQTLDRVWNALDALPRSTASPAFTRSTVEMAAVTAAKPATTRPNASRWRPPIWLLASGVATIIGGLLTWTLAAAPERRALRDLPVALHASALEQVGSVEFLKEFTAKSSGRLEAFQSEGLARNAEEWANLTATTPSERWEWVAELPSGDLAMVNERLAAFQAKSDAKQSRLVTLSEEIAAAGNAAELRDSALVYESMVERLPASEQLRLRQMEPGERLRTIERQAPRWARQRLLELTEVEKSRFRKALQDASKEDGGFAELLQGRFPGLSPEAKDRVRNRPQLAAVLVTGFVANSDRRRPPSAREGRNDRAERFFKKIVAVWNDWLDEVQVGLPSRVQEMLADVNSDEQRARLLMSLLRDTGGSDLGTAFAELPNDQIDTLLLLPREDFITALNNQMVGGFPEPPGRPGERGFGRPPGPPPGFDRFPRGEGPPEAGARFDNPQRRPPPPRRERPRAEERPPFNGE